MKKLEEILDKYKRNQLSTEDACRLIDNGYYSDIGHTIIDTGRVIRTGYPEAIFCKGKTTERIIEIMKSMKENGINILATRMTSEVYLSISNEFPHGVYSRDASIFTLLCTEQEISGKGFIAVVCAGTSDISVAEEAAITAEFYGHSVKRFYDVGIAGIHRLFRCIDEIRNAKVIIAVAGMEGALASVIAGLVKTPVIAVPVSTGYGASFSGVAALLSMLTSCSSGISVVNIDNGFGAAQFASRICSL